MYEAIVFMNRKFPTDFDNMVVGELVVEYVDAGQSLARLVGRPHRPTGAGLENPFKLQNPFKKQFPTITGHAAIVMRTSKKLNTGGEVRLRLIHGAELMHLMGYHWSCRDPHCLPPQESTMVSMAGNAFSAFAAGPFAMLAIAAAASMSPKPCFVGTYDLCSDKDSSDSCGSSSTYRLPC